MRIHGRAVAVAFLFEFFIKILLGILIIRLLQGAEGLLDEQVFVPINLAL